MVNRAHVIQLIRIYAHHLPIMLFPSMVLPGLVRQRPRTTQMLAPRSLLAFRYRRLITLETLEPTGLGYGT